MIPDNPYPHILQWNRMGRKGQACRILAMRGGMIQVQFEVDGFTALLDRRAIRRKPCTANPSTSSSITKP